MCKDSGSANGFNVLLFGWPRLLLRRPQDLRCLRNITYYYYYCTPNLTIITIALTTPNPLKIRCVDQCSRDD